MKIGNVEIFNKVVSTGSNTISFTDTQLDAIYKLYQNNNSLTVTFILTTDNKYTDTKTCTINLKGNQRTGKVNVLNVWKRSKKWINVNNDWKRCVRWVNINGNWKRCI